MDDSGFPFLAAIAVRTAVVFVLVTLGVRLTGKRQTGEMNVHDLLLVLVIANAVQNALVGGDDTLVGGLVSAATLLVVNRAITEAVERFPWLDRRMSGEPVILVSEALPRWKVMQREGVTRDELFAALRQHGIGELDGVRLAVLEVDGTISVVPKEATVHRVRHRVRGLRTG